MHPLVGTIKLQKEYEQYLARYDTRQPSRGITREHMAKVFEELSSPNPAEPGADAWRDAFNHAEQEASKTQLEGRNYNELLCGLCSDICSGMDQLGCEIRTPMLAAEFPTGYANACIKTTPYGDLILVNTGLIDLIYRFSNYVSVSRQLRPRFGGRKPTGSIWANTVWIDSGYSPSEVALDAACVLLRYFFYRHVSGPYYFKRHGGFSVYWGMRLCNACEQFVVAHEIAHLQMRDGRGCQPSWAIMSPGIAQAPTMEHDLEYDADLLAMRLLLALAMTPGHSPAGEQDESGRFLTTATVVSAPFFFLSIDKVLEAAKGALGVRSSKHFHDSHPKADARIAALRTAVVQLDAGAALLAEAEATSRFVLELGNKAIEYALKFDLGPIKREANYEDIE